MYFPNHWKEFWEQKQLRETKVLTKGGEEDDKELNQQRGGSFMEQDAHDDGTLLRPVHLLPFDKFEHEELLVLANKK